MTKRTLISLAALALVLSACGGRKDKSQSANDIDPAVANVLEDQIMVDPNLVGQANRLGRKEVTGSQAAVPAAGIGGASAAALGKLLKAPAPVAGAGRDGITLGQLAKDQATDHGQAADCEKNFQYSASWAAKLPGAFPLYPDAQVTEAAGNNEEPCRMRLVSFASKATLQTLVDFYYTQAIRNGFNAEHRLADGEHVLAGTRQHDGGAYYLTFNARKDGGTDIDMIVNHGQ